MMWNGKVICQQCRWWRVLSRLENTTGRCVRHAPRPVIGNSPHTQWPKTDMQDFCGEFDAI